MKSISIAVILIFIYSCCQAQDFVSAEPVGGRNQLRYFIDQELVYPEVMYNNEIEGTVSFLFDIDEKGHVIDIRNITMPDSSALAETLRIFYLIEWQPATFRGIASKDTKKFEITFNKKKYNRLVKVRGYSIILNPYEPIDSSGKIYWYRNVETSPHPVFSKKEQNLSSFIAANLKYPEAAIKQNVSGTVKLSFVVETNGKISNMVIVNSLGAGCNEEAIRLLRSLNWMPGTYDGKAVRTRTSLAISFNLDRGADGLFNPVIKSSYGG
jgi:TonB family protein